MEEFYAITDEDREVLLEMARYFRARVNKGNSALLQEDDATRSGCYVAVSPSTGIPAMSQVGTAVFPGTGPDIEGTGADGKYFPGSAYCQVFMIVLDDTNPSLLDAGFDVEVFNLAEEIPANSWVIVDRDKFGVWWVTGVLSSGGSNVINPPNSYCDAAKWKKTDCLLASGPYGSVVLHNSAGTWYSSTNLQYSDIPSTGSGGVGETGQVEVYFSLGQVHMLIAGMELLNCGDGCYKGGALTGHLPDSGDDCSGASFEVCLTCIPCAGITTTCCPSTVIPGTIYATFHGSDTSCNGTTIALSYSNPSPLTGYPQPGWWTGFISFGRCNPSYSGINATGMYFVFWCSGGSGGTPGTWYIEARYADGTSAGTWTANVADVGCTFPFDLHAGIFQTVFNSQCGCDGNGYWTVSDSGSGGGGDCFATACGSTGVSSTLTVTTSGATGKYASAPSSFTMSCHAGGTEAHVWISDTPYTFYTSGGTPQTGYFYIQPGTGSVPVMFHTSFPVSPSANAGYACYPFAGVFVYNDGAGNAITFTVSG